MAYDYSKLLGRIVEKCGTQAKFSEAMGLSEHSISAKLNNRVGWKQSEIVKCCEVLDIAKGDISRYFFAI